MTDLMDLYDMDLMTLGEEPAAGAETPVVAPVAGAETPVVAPVVAPVAGAETPVVAPVVAKAAADKLAAAAKEGGNGLVIGLTVTGVVVLLAVGGGCYWKNKNKDAGEGGHKESLFVQMA